MEENKEKASSVSLAETYLRVIAKHSISLHLMSRDMNVAKINFQKLVELEGGKVRKDPDAMFLSEERLEKSLSEEKEKLSPEKKKKEEEQKEKKKSLIPEKIGKKIEGIKGKAVNIFDKLKVIFSPKNFMKVLGKIALPLLILTTIWEGITGAWEAYQATGSIWEAFKGGIGQIVEFFTFGLIDKKMVSEFFDNLADFFKPVVDAIKTFFGDIGKWVGDKFDGVVSLFQTKPKAPKSDPNSQAELDKQQAAMKKAEEEKKKAAEAEYKRANEEAKKADDAKKAAQKTPKQKHEEAKAKAEAQKQQQQKPTPAAAAQATTTTAKPTPAAPTTKPTTKPTAATKPSGDDKWVKDMIIRHEGKKNKPYKDTKNLWTVGVGHLIGDGKTLPKEYDREFTDQEVYKLFDEDYEHHKKIAEKTPGYDLANEKGKAAFIDLAFNMGQWWNKWPNTSKLLKDGNFSSAADDFEKSAWYKQVGKRATEVVGMIREGKGESVPSNVVVSGTGEPIRTGSGGFLTTTQQETKKETKDEMPKGSGDDQQGLKYPESGSARLTSLFGYRNLGGKKEFHPGVDYAGVSKGTPIQLKPEGKVVGIDIPGYGKSYDILVNGEILRFGHMDQRLFNDGDKIPANSIIGTIGNTGHSTGDHLHFEHRKDRSGKTQEAMNKTYDPLKSGAVSLIGIGDKPLNNEVTKQLSSKVLEGEGGLDSSGSKIAANSIDLSASQRQQQKPQTPIIVNAPTTNTTVIANNKNVNIPPKRNTAGALATAAT